MSLGADRPIAPAVDVIQAISRPAAIQSPSIRLRVEPKKLAPTSEIETPQHVQEAIPILRLAGS
jgi:hypothetical protein